MPYLEWSLGMYHFPVQGVIVPMCFLIDPLNTGRCRDRNPKVVSGHSFYRAPVPSLLLVA